jgi:peptide chain release factor subunit 1
VKILVFKVGEAAEYKLRRLIKMLETMKGRHTELVSVYIPAGYSIHEVMNQLKQEQSTAENIKSKQVRKNVVSALEKIMRHLQLYKKTPDHGLAIFCGNVSEREGVTDIELWAIEPPEPIKTKLYWCDQRFDLEPLREMVKEKEIYGMICLDKSEADVALLVGKKIKSLVHFDSIVPGKSRAGGQSSARFARVREGLLNDFLKQVGNAANKAFEGRKDMLGIILSGPGPIKEEFHKGDFLNTNVKKKIIGVIDTSYTGEYGLHETLERAEDLLKETSVTKEKMLLQRFFGELQKPNGMVAYGLKEVIDALEMGAVDTLIVSEDLEAKEIEFQCGCGSTREFVRKEAEKQCHKCKMTKQILGERDVADALEQKVKEYGTKLEIVSSDTREGLQFKQLGGIGALLRYQI